MCDKRRRIPLTIHFWPFFLHSFSLIARYHTPAVSEAIQPLGIVLGSDLCVVAVPAACCDLPEHRDPEGLCVASRDLYLPAVVSSGIEPVYDSSIRYLKVCNSWLQACAPPLFAYKHTQLYVLLCSCLSDLLGSMRVIS